MFQEDTFSCAARAENDGRPSFWNMQRHITKHLLATKGLAYTQETDDRLGRSGGGVGLAVFRRHGSNRMIIAMPESSHTQITHDGSLFRVEVVSWTDEQGRKVTREVVRHPGAVMIVPILDDGRIVMIQNERIAVGEVLWELPAGKLEPGEDPKHAASRELEEETGYRASTMDRIGEFYTSPGFADELMHVYLARDLVAHSPRLEPGEQITVELVEADQARKMIREGVIRDGKTIAGLLMHMTSDEVIH